MRAPASRRSALKTVAAPSAGRHARRRARQVARSGLKCAAQASITGPELDDTLSDTVWRGQAQTPADGIPLRPPQVEYETAVNEHRRARRGRT